MDECMLNDLLECSVCLERLDTSSKVLPCQHTFCKKCLEEIVTTHKELRCPECRVLVDIKIEDLPPNVLLMRILEGMRNAPKKQQQRGSVRGAQIQQHPHVLQPHILQPIQQPILCSPADRSHVSNKGTPPHPMLAPHQPYARAVYDYLSKEPDDLSFKKGDIILLRKRVDTHWYYGESGGKQGVFPLTYVQIMIPLPSHVPQCKALYDFRMTGEDEEGCLAFSKGAIINVIRRVDENWAEGRLNERVGIFPLAFVELNGLARSLMKLSTNSQPGPSRVAPPTPTAEDSSPLIPTDHTNILTAQNVTRPTPPQSALAQPPPPLGSESSSTISSTSPSTTPNTSSSNTSSSSSTAPSSPTSPPPPRNASNVSSPPPRPATHHVSPTQQVSQREKRHSFSSPNSGHHHHSNHRHSAEILSGTTDVAPPVERHHRRSGSSDISTAPPVPPSLNINQHGSTTTNNLPAAYIALYPYKPQKADELELRKGGIYMVTERCQDGWFKGTSNRTQKCGVFPGNYVAPARGLPRGTSSSLPQGSSPRNSGAPSLEPRIAITYTRSGKPHSGNSTATTHSPRQGNGGSSQPPELPPRSVSPTAPTSTVSCSWHGQPENSATVPLGRSQSAVMTSAVTSTNLATTPAGKFSEKTKERKEKGTVSLMRRLTSMKRSKSPPPTTYSMDNPVFEDSSSINSMAGTHSPAHTVHVRSGSCPSQLLQALPTDVNNGGMPNTTVAQNAHHRLLATGTSSGSQRTKHKERPHVMQMAAALQTSSRHGESSVSNSASSPSANHHRKSNSLDAGSKPKTVVPPLRERFRCIVPYPPNSEYELELRLNDIIYVHKKRDDGWYKGTQQRTGRTGLFPASFVESF